MKIKSMHGKIVVNVIGNMSSSFSKEFEKELKIVCDKFNNVANIQIDCSGKTHYKLYVTTKSGAKNMFTFSTTNVNTIKVYMGYVRTFLARS